MTVSPFVRYTSDVDDNLRWAGFPFRRGDIVISTRSKHGTTWMQWICALLVHGGPDLPGPLSEISPWLDWIPEPVPDVLARLDAQRHRRFVKTHTPLDGLPADARATYVVVARHPLDGAVSMYHQGRNMDRARVAQLMGQPAPTAEDPQPVGAWLRDWALAERSGWLDSRTGVLHHVADAWARAEVGGRDPTLPAVVLVHYSDLLADLSGQMRRLAGLLGIEVDEARWPASVAAAGFAAMRARAAELAPDRGGVLLDRDRFFRAGRSGEGRSLLTAEDLAGFEARCRAEAPGDVVDWLLR